jgi:CHAD domain-containing protein
MRLMLLFEKPATPESLASALGPAVEIDRPSQVRYRFLDSFEWSVHRTCGRLTIEDDRDRKTLRWSPGGDAPPYVLPIARDIRFPRDLPPGFLRDALAPILEERALLTMAEYASERCRARWLDEGGNSVVQLTLDNLSVVDEEGNRHPETRSVLGIEGLPGHERAFDRVVELAVKAGAKEIGHSDLLAYGAEARGRWPNDYSSKPKVKLKPGTPAGKAVRKILLQSLAVLEANVDGVLRDVDVEFLHDLRVATRRTRSAIAQLKGVLPRDRVDRFIPELKWLGTVTGPLRDLDVYLIEMVGYRELLGDAAEQLDPLRRLITEERRRALRRVRSGLRSKRFQRLIEGWRAFLEEPDADGDRPPKADGPILELANARILKAYKRIVKRGSKLGDDPPAEALHQLRIDAKKLRYLLEFFAGLYPAGTISRLVKELKQLQDILGGFNDMEVQQHKLEDFAREMMAKGDPVPATVLIMGRLAATLEERQEAYRFSFADRFAVFASDSSRARYSELFGGGGQ